VLTRREFLELAGGSVAGLLASGARGPAAALASSAPSSQSFHSRPDLRPPTLNLRYTTAAPPPVSEGYMFVGPTSKPGAQAGALIVDTNGEPVWFHPVKPGWWVTDFRVQEYHGKPALTWWEGEVRPPGYGHGQGVILDSSYQEIAVVRAAGGRQADLHEFLVTPEGTALITCHPQTVQADLSGVGGPSDGQVLEPVIQEIDIATGRLLFEWRALEHVAVEESYLSPGGAYDYLHVNSIGLTPDGHLLVSGRHTCAMYKVHRRTGRVLWRLGGRRSSFAVGRRARFHWQHDARHLPGGLITVFDNGAGPVKSEAQSRGLVLQLDFVTNSVHLVRAYRHPVPVLSSAMGDVQTLPDGNVMVGYGLVPLLSEFAPDGQLLGQLWLPWGYNCYRGFRMPWVGTPTDQPAIASTPGPSSGSTTIYASWNGATAVASWQLSTGSTPSQLQAVGTTPRSGFETAIPLAASQGYATVSALDGNGNILSVSPPVGL
jgi:hypothetical protein